MIERAFPASLILLSGCHLFASGVISTTCEDLDRGCLPASDTHEEEQETGEPIEETFSTEMVVGMSRTGLVQVVVVSPEGEVLEEVTVADEAASGPVAWDGDEGRLFFHDSVGGTFYMFEDGEVSLTISTALDVVSVHIDGGVPYLLTDGSLYRVGLEAGAASLMLWDTFSSGRALFEASEANAFVLDAGQDSNLPDIFNVDLTTTSVTLKYEDFDDSRARVASGFLKEDEPWVCSVIGGMYMVAALADGSRAPAALPDPDLLEEITGQRVLSDVTDCAWDPGAKMYIFMSRSAGVLALDSWGNVEERLVPGGTPFRAFFR